MLKKMKFYSQGSVSALNNKAFQHTAFYYIKIRVFIKGILVE